MERSLREKLEGGKFGDVTPVNARRMKAVRGKGNKTTEARFRGLLIQAGFRGWQVSPKGLPGNPDFYFSVVRLAVFLDGCFWHGCPLCGHIPNVRRAYWAAKIARNQERDREKECQLKELGIRVLRFWEHELAESPAECLQRLRRANRLVRRNSRS